MKRKTIAIFALLAILFVFLIFRGIPLAINSYLNNNAEEIVSDMITRTPDLGDHEVKFGRILFDFNYRGTFLELADIQITPAADIPEEKVQIYLQAKSAHLTGFSWNSYFFNNSITLDSAYLQNVFVETKSPPLDSLNLGSEQDKRGNDYDFITVDNIRFNRLSFYNRDSSNDSIRVSIKDLTVSANNFKLSKEDIQDRDALFHVDMVEGYMDQASLHFNDYRNAFYFKDLSFNSEERHLLIAGIELDNKLEKYEYINQFEYETDWIELDKGELEIFGINFLAFFQKKVIHIESINAKDLVVNIFRDKRKPKDTTRRPEMVHERIRGMPKNLIIEELKLENAYIAYQERPDTDSPHAGSIFFDSINGSIRNITNNEEIVAQNNKMELASTGKIMGIGDMNLSVNFILDDEDGEFYMKGSVGAMPLMALNSMIGPETRMGIKEGHLDNLFFNIRANDYEGSGDLIMKYHDLKIQFLNKDYQEDKNIFRQAKAFIANTFVVKNNNPGRNGEVAEGKVYVKKDPSKFVFNYWWELILSGMMSTLSGDTEEDMRKAAKETE